MCSHARLCHIAFDRIRNYIASTGLSGVRAFVKIARRVCVRRGDDRLFRIDRKRTLIDSGDVIGRCVLT